jgi:hypothetical protein
MLNLVVNYVMIYIMVLIWKLPNISTAMIKQRHACELALFAWLISHQPTILFSQNKPAPAISQQYFSLTTNPHQPSATS